MVPRCRKRASDGFDAVEVDEHRTSLASMPPIPPDLLYNICGLREGHTIIRSPPSRMRNAPGRFGDVALSVRQRSC